MSAPPALGASTQEPQPDQTTAIWTYPAQPYPVVFMDLNTFMNQGPTHHLDNPAAFGYNAFFVGSFPVHQSEPSVYPSLYADPTNPVQPISVPVWGNVLMAPSSSPMVLTTPYQQTTAEPNTSNPVNTVDITQPEAATLNDDTASEPPEKLSTSQENTEVNSCTLLTNQQSADDKVESAGSEPGNSADSSQEFEPEVENELALPEQESRITYDCDQCGKTYKHRDTLRFHLEFECSKLLNKACTLCDFKTPSSSQLGSHMFTEHWDVSSEESEPEVEDVSAPLEQDSLSSEESEPEVEDVSAPLEQESLSSEESEPEVEDVSAPLEQESHSSQESEPGVENVSAPPEQESGTTYDCDRCNKKYTYKKSLIFHLRVECGGKTPGKACQLCDYRTNNVTSLKRHIRSKHSTDSSQESKPGVENVSALAEQESVSSEESEPEVEDVSAPLEQESQSSLESAPGVENVSAPPEQESGTTYNCDRCKKKYRHKRSLSFHLRVKCGGKTPGKTCQLCDYRTNNATSLKLHIRSKHSTGMTYDADGCSERLKSGRYCTICGCQTYSNSHLKRHIFTNYLGEITYDCDQCGKKYKKVDSLISHVKFQCGELPDKACPLCNYKTDLGCHLKRHIMDHHKSEPSVYSTNPVQPISVPVWGNVIAPVRSPEVLTTPHQQTTAEPNTSNPVNTVGTTQPEAATMNGDTASIPEISSTPRENTEVNTFTLMTNQESADDKVVSAGSVPGNSAGLTYNCDQCGRKYKYKRTLRNHNMRVQCGKLIGLTYNCDQCGRKFKNKRTLRNHNMRVQCSKLKVTEELQGNGENESNKERERETGEMELITIPGSSESQHKEDNILKNPKVADHVPVWDLSKRQKQSLSFKKKSSPLSPRKDIINDNQMNLEEIAEDQTEQSEDLSPFYNIPDPLQKKKRKTNVLKKKNVSPIKDDDIFNRIEIASINNPTPIIDILNQNNTGEEQLILKENEPPSKVPSKKRGRAKEIEASKEPIQTNKENVKKRGRHKKLKVEDSVIEVKTKKQTKQKQPPEEINVPAVKTSNKPENRNNDPKKMKNKPVSKKKETTEPIVSSKSKPSVKKTPSKSRTGTKRKTVPTNHETDESGCEENYPYQSVRKRLKAKSTKANIDSSTNGLVVETPKKIIRPKRKTITKEPKVLISHVKNSPITKVVKSTKKSQLKDKPNAPTTKRKYTHKHAVVKDDSTMHSHKLTNDSNTHLLVEIPKKARPTKRKVDTLEPHVEEYVNDQNYEPKKKQQQIVKKDNISNQSTSMEIDLEKIKNIVPNKSEDSSKKSTDTLEPHVEEYVNDQNYEPKKKQQKIVKKDDISNQSTSMEIDLEKIKNIVPNKSEDSSKKSTEVPESCSENLEVPEEKCKISVSEDAEPHTADTEQLHGNESNKESERETGEIILITIPWPSESNTTQLHENNENERKSGETEFVTIPRSPVLQTEQLHGNESDKESERETEEIELITIPGSPESHKEEPRLECVVCDKLFNREEQLEEHMMLHTGQKLFTTQHPLRPKIRSRKEEIFSCNQCQYLTNRKGLLMVHLRQVHEDVKLWSCVEAWLQRRQQTHPVEKLFSCDQCPFKTVYKCNLKKHTRKHDNPFSCSECKYTAKNGEGLEAHMEKKHPSLSL